ncbi:hypothetical protein M8J77_007250 [Diaphorina citri]|nr:hypothetical protein M8J77_007250 [Diaphorina citri]
MDRLAIPTNICRHFILLIVIANLISCQQKSIVDKDNNIVLTPRDDINISLSIDGFDNSTFGNIAQLFSDKVFNSTESAVTGEDATETTTVEDEDAGFGDTAWDPDMFSDPSSETSDNSTSELEDIFNKNVNNENKDDDFMSETGDIDATTQSTTTTKRTYIQKIPRRQKPYPSAARRRRQAQLDVDDESDLSEEVEAEEEVNNEQNHFLWVRAAPRTSVSQIENSIQENDDKTNSSNTSIIRNNNTNFIAKIPTTEPTIIPTTEKLARSKTARSELHWVSKVLTEAMYDFSPALSNNSLCSAHSEMYRTHLQNLTLWALKMLDSSALTPSGLLSANMYQLGNFDECVNIVLPSHGLQGQYCLASATFSPTKASYASFYDGDHSRDFVRPGAFDFVWDSVKENRDPAKVSRNKFHWALCIPSSCTAKDLQVTLDQALSTLTHKYHIHFNVTVPEKNCYVKRTDEVLPVGFWVLTAVTLLLVSLVCLATCYDLVVFRRNDNTEHNQTLKKWLIPFSGLSNMEKLGSPNDQAEFSIIHALKAISMCQIIVGHRNMNVLGNVTFNPEFTEEKSSQLVWSYFNNGTLVVDTFFLVGGFLTFYFIFFELDKRKGQINYLVVFLYRFIRVTPVYAFVIFFYMYMLPHMNDGPLWRDIIGRESNRCQKNWWSNLLYINNYYHEDEQCMVQSWYLSCDFHFFIAGTFLTYLVWRYRRYAKIILTVTLTVFIVLPFSYVYRNGYWGHYRTYISQMRDPVSHPEFQSLYVKSHFRAIPYIIGLIVAYVYIQLKEKQYKFSTISLWTISLTAFCLGHTPYLLAGLAYIPGRPYYRLEQAMFNPLQRVVWSLCIGWIIIGHGTTGFGPLSRILGHRVFVPFSRLTFCAYLIHVAVQLTSIATMRSPTYVSYTGLILGVFGDLMFTFFCAFLLNIMIESPLDRFQKKVVKSLIGGFSPGATKDTTVKEEIIEAAFQQGLGTDGKPCQHDVTIGSTGANVGKTIGSSGAPGERRGSDQCHL